MTDRHFIIPEPVLVALLNYLQTRPYSEVWQGIEALKRLEVSADTEPKAKK